MPTLLTTSLCPHCRHVRTITTPKGSTFYLCELSTQDPHYPKYPGQPVTRCAGYERSEIKDAEEVKRDAL